MAHQQTQLREGSLRKNKLQRRLWRGVCVLAISSSRAGKPHFAGLAPEKFLWCSCFPQRLTARCHSVRREPLRETDHNRLKGKLGQTRFNQMLKSRTVSVKPGPLDERLVYPFFRYFLPRPRC
jgi:hypothetical protein